MAKFGRYDPRNKKKDRNKRHSQNKDIRIREVPEEKKYPLDKALKEVIYDDEVEFHNKRILTG